MKLENLEKLVELNKKLEFAKSQLEIVDRLTRKESDFETTGWHVSMVSRVEIPANLFKTISKMVAHEYIMQIAHLETEIEKL
jgi:hypothetical protein